MNKINTQTGNCLDILPTMEAGSVNCCVTSPPYFGLRDYGNDEQIGLEETPEAFVESMVNVFREVKRVLADDGTLWLNLGDSYAMSGLPGGNPDKHGGELRSRAKKRNVPKGLKAKDLIGIPWRVALRFAGKKDGICDRTSSGASQTRCQRASPTDARKRMSISFC